jgi:hypothetical protein
MTPDQTTALACAACFAVGFIGGFAGGFRVAAMIRLGVRKVRAGRAHLRVAASDGELQEDFA